MLRYDALGRLIRTDLPNGTLSRVEFDAWKQTTFDPNDNIAPLDPDDTAGESLWYQARKGLDPDTDPEGRAAVLAHAHRGTPGVAHLDTLGRTFLTIEDNGDAGAYATRLSLDLEGNPLVITDARLNAAMEHVFAMGGRALWQKSCDAGERWMLADVAGAPLRAWDERGHTKRAMYDAARRATHAYVQQGADAERLVGRTVYGEGHPDAEELNLRGRAYQVYDGAGLVTSEAYDFKGNLLGGSRRLATTYRFVADWSPLEGLTDVADIATAAEPLLEAEVFTSATAYDALNRPTSMTAPDASEIRPTYNEAGLLEKVEARARGALTWTTFVDDIDYDAKGQREKIVYGNGTRTTYAYDSETFRLVRLKTVRKVLGSDDTVLQNLTYTYDPVGNITEIKDSAQRTVFFDNDVVSPSTQYVHDALYRLIEATGREHAGGVADVQRDQNDVPLLNLPHANDALALRTYVETYVYDAVGNILTMHHQAGDVDWTRRYEIAATSNRLLSTSLPGDSPVAPYSATYAYDEHGSMTSMPHLPKIGWDHNDQMQQVDLGGGGTAYYNYDAAGQRVRKVWEHSGLVEERIYLGGWEVYRKRDSLGNLLLERETLHGMDGTRRVLLVETKTVDVDAVGLFTPVSRCRFQLDNHLGSASLEMDESGLVIKYEEYHPYGTTSYASGRSGAEVSGKRYRYTGKERDEETGLYYHGARHYAAWLARWTSADPAGMVDGPNGYPYVRDNPICLTDLDGMEAGSQRLTNEQIAALRANGPAAHIPNGARVGWLNQSGHSAGTYVKKGTSRGAPPGVSNGGDPHRRIPGAPPLAPPGAPSGNGEPRPVLGSSLSAPPSGVAGSGRLSSGSGDHRTDLDIATVIAGLLNFTRGDDRGVSGGIPGGMGTADNASPELQALYVAVTANQVAGMALDLAKALWNAGKGALGTITGRLAADQVLQGTLQESASVATTAAVGSGLAVPEKIAASTLGASAGKEVAPEGAAILFRGPRPEQVPGVLAGGFDQAAYPSPGLFVALEGDYVAEYAKMYGGGILEIGVPGSTMTTLREGGHILPDLDPSAAARGALVIAPSGFSVLNSGATIRHIPHGSFELWSRFGIVP